MNPRLSTLLATVTLLAVSIPLSAGQTFFAAAAMTKAQKNSSIPTDAGIFLHDDSGDWSGFGPKIQAVNSASQDPSDPDTFFLACGNGIVRSTDNGISWRLVTGWEISDAYAIAIDPIDGHRVYAATGWGLWRSEDRGDSWQPAFDGLTETFSKTLLIDTRQPDRLLAGTAGGLFVSTNRAGSWNRIAAVPPVNVLRLRRGAEEPETWLAVTEGRGAWLSTDDAETWESTAPEVSEANLYAAAVDPLDSDHLAVGGWGVGVWVSTDGGETWQDRRDGLPSPNILALAFDPAQPGRLWASSFEEGTSTSDDFGRTWTEAGLKGAYVIDTGFLDLEP
jgi:photosystem II stability/assembly factor-like uncharacterized protein